MLTKIFTNKQRDFNKQDFDRKLARFTLSAGLFIKVYIIFLPLNPIS
jgi:hypothetical protein